MTSSRRRNAGDAALAAVTAAGLLVWNNVVGAHPWHRRHYVSSNILATAVLLGVARRRGISLDDLGVSRHRVPAGLRRGAASAVVVLGTLGAAASSPRHRRLLRDARVEELRGPEVAYHAVIRVPLGTVVWEETAFRAVLPALLRRVLPPGAATLTNSLLFGLWHLRPTGEALRLNGLSTKGPSGAGTTVGAIALTALADLMLAREKRLTGSLAAPALVHVAVNSGGTVAAAGASRLRPRPRRDRGPGRTPAVGMLRRPVVG